MKKTVKIRVNPQLEALCEILDTTPEEVLQHFSDNLSLDYQYTHGSDERGLAVGYFMRVGYGTHLFDPEEVADMFDELNRIRYSFYRYGNNREQEYLQDRERQYKALFTEWKSWKAKKKGGL